MHDQNRCPGPIPAARAHHTTHQRDSTKAQSNAIGTHESHRGTQQCTAAAPHAKYAQIEPKNMRRAKETREGHPSRRAKRTAPNEAQHDGGGTGRRRERWERRRLAAADAAGAACGGGGGEDDPDAEQDDPPPLGLTPRCCSPKAQPAGVFDAPPAQIVRSRARTCGDRPINPHILRKFTPRCAR